MSDSEKKENGDAQFMTCLCKQKYRRTEPQENQYKWKVLGATDKY